MCCCRLILLPVAIALQSLSSPKILRSFPSLSIILTIESLFKYIFFWMGRRSWKNSSFFQSSARFSVQPSNSSLEFQKVHQTAIMSPLRSNPRYFWVTYWILAACIALKRLVTTILHIKIKNKNHIKCICSSSMSRFYSSMSRFYLLS